MTQETDIEDDYIEPVLGEIDFSRKDILEIGCGSGAFTENHLTEARSILAIDLDQDGLEELQKTWESSEYVAKLHTKMGDITKLKLEENAYEIALFSSSL